MCTEGINGKTKWPRQTAWPCLKQLYILDQAVRQLHAPVADHIPTTEDHWPPAAVAGDAVASTSTTELSHMPSNTTPGMARNTERITACYRIPPSHYGLVKMCLCHIRKTRSVIVPWTHIQPCPGHIYSRVLDTYTIVPWTRSISVSLTHLNMSLPHLYMEKKTKILTHFKLLPDFQTIV